MSTLESLLRHDRALVIGALMVDFLLAWASMLTGAGVSMDTLEQRFEQQHEGRFAALTFVSYGPNGIIPEDSLPHRAA